MTGRSTRSLKRMRTVIAVLASVFATGCVGTKHASPDEVSALEVSVYKTGMGMGCRNQGKSLGHPPDQVERQCRCVLDILNSRVTEEEWKRATFYAQQRRDREEQQVLVPHLSAAKGCK